MRYVRLEGLANNEIERVLLRKRRLHVHVIASEIPPSFLTCDSDVRWTHLNSLLGAIVGGTRKGASQHSESDGFSAMPGPMVVRRVSGFI